MDLISFAFSYIVSTTVDAIKKQRVNPNDFTTIKIIGQGHFGQVKVVKEKQTGEVLALKCIRKSEILTQQEV